MHCALIAVLLLTITALSSAQWGGWGNNQGGSEVIERDITTINNPLGGSETIEKDVIIENNNNNNNGGWNNGWNRGGWGKK